MSITKQTRRESYDKIKPERKLRHQVILDAWEGPMTAREICRKLGYGSDLNMVRPRITELVQSGHLVESGEKYDIATDRNVAAWRKAENPKSQEITLSCRVAAEILKPHFPVMHSGIMSQAMRPEVSGIRLTSKARRILFEEQARREAIEDGDDAN